MLRTLIRDALASEAPVADLTVCGWIRTRRDAKDVIFLEINDGSCLTNLQCVVDPDSPVREKLGGDGTGASLCVKGDLVASPGKGQRWELHAKTLRILGHADPETYPLQKKRHSDEFLRSIAHLRVRTNKYSSVFRVRARAAAAVHAFFRRNGFFWVHTPILTGSDCEGSGEMFRLTTLSTGEMDL